MQRKLSLLLVFLLLFLFVLVPLRADKPPTVNRAGSESAPPEKLILGEAEYVAIPALNTVFAARIDTGAKRSSIYAVDIETFERDGNLWVRFTIKNPAKDEEFPLEREVTRTARIKQQGDESERRHSIELVLTMGELTKEIDISLVDRSNFQYPLLIGRDFLKGAAIVDVAQKYTQQTPGAPERSKKRSK
ncbi:MAG: RimK/LysX family protein [Gammaproteobacteria bacterium]|jgi:hypothetical protein